MLHRLLVAAAVVAAPMAADAHGPSRQRVIETVEIAAPPETVWARIGDFADMSWHPAVHSTEAEGGNVVDATRRLTLGGEGGGVLDEILYRYEPEKRSYSYRITAVDVQVLPVNNYSSTIEVKEGADGGSLVEWRGAFYRGFPNNNPPPELSDEAAIEAVTAVYRTGLDALKAEIEASN
jgi:carbon monoxide dehydrogenase subunit G